MNKKIILVLLAVIFLSPLFAKESGFDPYGAEITKAFADQLLMENFIDEAESEYKRALFISQEEQKDDLILSLENIYAFEQNKNGAAWLFNSFYKDAQTGTKEKLAALYAGLTFKERKLEDFIGILEFVLPELNLFSAKVSFLLPFSQKLLSHDIKSAAELCNSIQNDALAEAVKNLTKSCNSYKEKNPVLAVVMSSVMPGSGKWYAGSMRAGMSSFLYTAGFAGGTVWSIYKFGFSDWRPYTFGSIALAFYIADLYGAYKSAVRYNQAIYRKLCEETDSLYESLY